MIRIFIIIALSLILFQCKNEVDSKIDTTSNDLAIIDSTTVDKVITGLIDMNGENYKFRIERGVSQVASFWRSTDGTIEDFEKYCSENFITDSLELLNVFMRLSANYEILNGNFNKIVIELSKPLHLDIGEILPVDELFGAYDPAAHITEDFFSNKIAMMILLNFPFYSLQEKEDLGKNWNREQWAFARIGDIYTSRVPAELLQKKSEATTGADTYIAEYNVFMGNLVNNGNQTLFPKDLKLITHWGLRDELKSNYNTENGIKKQRMIYEVMKDIISQDIPQEIINSDKYQWNPYTDKAYENGVEKTLAKENNNRYQHLLDIFHAFKAIDQYSPQYPTYIKRKFDQEMEISCEDVENLFTELVSSPEVKQVAGLIKERLGRGLEPFDIWYNGFRSSSKLTEPELDKITQTKYPSSIALKNDLPNILIKLGFNQTRAKEISSKIDVDPARGAGHAWGAEMKTENARLRTRIGKNGMDYKGYNIAVHEFGHNVEQTITLNDVDYYAMHGVPNTAFTEAIAFIFQKRDLELLNLSESDNEKMHYMALDNFWSCYEIMGVSLVDIKVWKWMYANPDANAEELKNAVMDISKEIWNEYYADVFGIKDQTILGIYSHMIDAPLYLSAYPIGHLIDFQIEQFISDKSFPDEIERILKNGKLTPQIWMKEAVGKGLSNNSLLSATKSALNALKI
ncbi:MAG: hypothetical protein ABIJ97_17655 [Bacteroidota bacterium]